MSPARRRRFLALAAAALALAMAAQVQARRLYPLPYPPFEELVGSPRMLQDLSLIVSGFRRLAADLAWVQLLQYLGGEGLPEEGGSRSYDRLKDMTLRVTRIDPHFTHAYVFGAGILAYFRGVDRPLEALELLREGARHNPGYWPLKAYMAAILYKMRDQPEPMIEQLAAAADHPDCPAIVRAILANLYKSRGRYREAIAVWEKVLGDPKSVEEHPRAEEQLRRLAALLRSRR